MAHTYWSWLFTLIPWYKLTESSNVCSFPAAKLKHIEAKMASIQAERRIETAGDILKLIQAGEFSKDHISLK